MAKRVMDKNQQPTARQALEKLSPSTRGGQRRDENREVHRVGAGESSASTTIDTNSKYCHTIYHKTDNFKIMAIKNLCRLPVNFLLFPCKTQ